MLQRCCAGCLAFHVYSTRNPFFAESERRFVGPRDKPIGTRYGRSFDLQLRDSTSRKRSLLTIEDSILLDAFLALLKVVFKKIFEKITDLHTRDIIHPLHVLKVGTKTAPSPTRAPTRVPLALHIAVAPSHQTADSKWSAISRAGNERVC